MKKTLFTLALLAGVAGFTRAENKVLLNETFSEVNVVYDDHYAPFDIEGWSHTSTLESPEMPYEWCVYASGTSTQVDNVGLIDYRYTMADKLPYGGDLYTPLLDLDGTYKLSFQWIASGVALDSSNPFDFKVKVVEEGEDVAKADVVWDFLNPEMLLESGVAPTEYTTYSVLWVGWQRYTSTIDLTPWKGKKVKVVFLYTANTARANSVEIDNIKVEEYDAPTSPIASFSANSWKFGDVYVGAKMYSDVITLTNTGNPGLKVSSIEVPDGFGVNANVDLLNTSLGKNENAKIQLTYTAGLTTPSEGKIVFKGNFPDAEIAVSANKKTVPDGGVFEGFEGESFPPAGWTAKKWKTSSSGIEGDKSAICNAYYEEENYLMTPRIDASKTGSADIEFSYYDAYSGEEADGADTQVTLSFSEDGGQTWAVVDTFDYNGTYNETIRKSYSKESTSDNCYWKFEWELTYYDSEYGAEASIFYLDAVVLSNLYGSGGVPTTTLPINPEDGATGIFNRGLTLSWEPAQFATGYKVYVGSDSAASNVVNGVDVGSAESYTLPDLQYSTAYSWRVEPYNEAGVAENVPTWSFSTIADPTVRTYPYREGFDNGVPPTGWNMVAEGSTRWTANEINPYDGTASAMGNPRGDEQKAILETPDFELPADPAYITFYWGDDVAIDLEKPEEGFAENTTTGSDGVSEISFEIYSNGEWKQAALLCDKSNKYWIRERIDLSAYAGQKVAFRWVYICHNYMRASGACLDNVSVELQSSEKLSFNVEGWEVGKLNHDQKWQSPDVFTVINDGNTAAEIASVEFGESNFSSSLKPGDKIESGKALNFTITAQGDENARTISDKMTITTVGGSSASFPVSAQILSADTRFYGFEQQTNGDLSVPELTFIDVDAKATIGLSAVTYPHKSEPMAFMVLNYTKNDWPNPYPRTGKQCLVTFGAVDYTTTEDWIVSPRLTATSSSSFDFYGRNYERKDNVGGGEVWAAAEVAVMVSESSNPSDRTAYTQVASYTLPYPEGEEYGEFKTSLSAYAGKQIYVALCHTTTEGLAYLYDDFQYNHFSEIDLSGVKSVSMSATGDIRLAESPVANVLRLTGVENAELTVYSISGSVVAKGHGNQLNVSGLSSGVYLLNVKSAEGVKAIKFVKK